MMRSCRRTTRSTSLLFLPPPKLEALSLAGFGCDVRLNPPEGLGSVRPTNHMVLRVLIAGLDPMTLVPNGLRNRAFSAEGQLCHCTDFISRITGMPGEFVQVNVVRCEAWANPSAFFAEPQRPEF